MKKFGKTKPLKKKLTLNTQPSPDIRALLLQLPGCHAFCKKNCKKSARQPSASTRRRSGVNRCSRKSGKSPCRSTGKANFNIVARRLRERVGPPLYRSGAGLYAASCQLASGFVMLLAGGKKASSPPKPCHPQSQRYTRSVMPLAKKSSKRPASRMKKRKARRLGRNVLQSGSLYPFRPNPLACNRAARPDYRPCCLKATASRTKKHPPWDGLKICQFAFLHKGRSLPRGTLCSSLPPLHKKFAWARGSPCPPGEWLKSHIAQPAGNGASSWSSQNIQAPPAPHTAS